MSSTLSSNELNQLIPLLDGLARIVGQAAPVGDAQLRTLLIGVGLEDNSTAYWELQRWGQILTALRKQPATMRQVAVETLLARKIPEVQVLRVVDSVVNSAPAEAKQQLKVSIEYLDFGLLPATQTAVADFTVEGGPGQILVDRENVGVIPTQFGAGVTKIRVEVKPNTASPLLYAELELVTSGGTVVVPVVASWEAADVSIDSTGNDLDSAVGAADFPVLKNAMRLYHIELSRLQQERDAQVLAINDLQSRLADAHDALQSIQIQLDDRANELKSAHIAQQEAEQRSAQYAQQIQELKDTLGTLQATRLTEVASLQRALEAMSNVQRSSDAALNTRTKELESARKAQQETENRLAESTRQIQELNNLLDREQEARRTAVEKRQQKLDSVIAELKTAKSMLDERATELERERRARQAAKADLLQTNQQVKQLQARLQESGAELNKKTTEIESERKARHAAESDLLQTNQQVKQLQARLQESGAELKKKTTEIESERKARQAAESDLLQTNQQVKQLQVLLQEQDTQLVQMAEFKQMSDNLSVALHDSEAALAEKIADLEVERKARQAAEDRVAELFAEILRLSLSAQMISLWQRALHRRIPQYVGFTLAATIVILLAYMTWNRATGENASPIATPSPMADSAGVSNSPPTIIWAPTNTSTAVASAALSATPTPTTASPTATATATATASATSTPSKTLTPTPTQTPTPFTFPTLVATCETMSGDAQAACRQQMIGTSVTWQGTVTGKGWFGSNTVSVDVPGSSWDRKVTLDFSDSDASARLNTGDTIAFTAKIKEFNPAVVAFGLDVVLTDVRLLPPAPTAPSSPTPTITPTAAATATPTATPTMTPMPTPFTFPTLVANFETLQNDTRTQYLANLLGTWVTWEGTVIEKEGNIATVDAGRNSWDQKVTLDFGDSRDHELIRKGDIVMFTAKISGFKDGAVTLFLFPSGIEVVLTDITLHSVRYPE
jgi:hypothetical protein